MNKEEMLKIISEAVEELKDLRHKLEIGKIYARNTQLFIMISAVENDQNNKE